MPSVPVDISFKPPPSLDANAKFFFSSAITHGKNFLYKMMNFPTVSRLFVNGAFLILPKLFCSRCPLPFPSSKQKLCRVRGTVLSVSATRSAGFGKTFELTEP